MIRISSENELLESFRPRDREQVQVPSTFKFPIAARDYLSWVEPSGHRVYLVFSDPQTEALLGIVFERTKGAADTIASMCQWCHSVRSGSAVGLLTTAVAPNRRVGVHLCADLSCREKVLSTPSIHDFAEGLSGQERVQRVIQRMGEFARANLF